MAAVKRNDQEKAGAADIMPLDRAVNIPLANSLQRAGQEIRSPPVIKRKKTPRKKCRYEAEEEKKIDSQ
ncbi:hypothetical protein [Oscillibacter sp. 1-3]|uniref:hypothetical protein n=1 Tax=Oscillibacter sp. 1-3 TaxID=1235797 RepID=UPI0003A3BC9B|nr:hypothetical protein [Oscillibacter sp. 1-3]